MKFLSTALATLSLVAVLCVNKAHAQSCQPLLNDLINFAANPQPGYEHRIKFQMVANREAADWAQYVGWQFFSVLRYTPGRYVGWFYLPPTLAGEGTQFFSDRTWKRTSEFADHPFDPDRTDNLRVSFDITPWSQSFGRLSYQFFNIPGTSDPQCRNGYLYGFFGDREHPDQMYIFTFKKVVVPIPH